MHGFPVVSYQPIQVDTNKAILLSAMSINLKPQGLAFTIATIFDTSSSIILGFIDEIVEK